MKHPLLDLFGLGRSFSLISCDPLSLCQTLDQGEERDPGKCQLELRKEVGKGGKAGKERRKTNLSRLALCLGIEDGRGGVGIRQDRFRSTRLEVRQSVGQERADGREIVAEVVERSPTIWSKGLFDTTGEERKEVWLSPEERARTDV
jgi:hypothetical protein